MKTVKIDINDLGDSSKFTKIDLAKALEKANIHNQVFYQGELREGPLTPFEVIIPEGVEKIAPHTFTKRYGLTKITFPNSVTSIGHFAFSQCRQLRTVILPQKLSIIENYLFNNCIALSRLDLPDSVTSIGDFAFTNCDNLNHLTLPYTLQDISKSAFSNWDTASRTYYDNSRVASLEILLSNCIATSDQVLQKFPALKGCKKLSKQIKLQLLNGAIYTFTYSDKDNHFTLQKRTLNQANDSTTILAEPVLLDENKRVNPYDYFLKALQKSTSIDQYTPDTLSSFLEDADGFELMIGKEEGQPNGLIRMTHGKNPDRGTGCFSFSDSLETSLQPDPITWPALKLNSVENLTIEAAKNHQPTLFFVRELSLHLILGKFSKKTPEKSCKSIPRKNELQLLNDLLKLNILGSRFVNALPDLISLESTDITDKDDVVNTIKKYTSTNDKISGLNSFTFRTDSNKTITLDCLTTKNIAPDASNGNGLLEAYFRANGSSLKTNTKPKTLWELTHAIRRWVKGLFGYTFESQCLNDLRTLYNSKNTLSIDEVKEKHIKVLKNYYGKKNSPEQPSDNNDSLQKNIRGSTFARLYKAKTKKNYTITDNLDNRSKQQTPNENNTA